MKLILWCSAAPSLHYQLINVYVNYNAMGSGPMSCKGFQQTMCLQQTVYVNSNEIENLDTSKVLYFNVYEVLFV